MRPYTVLVVDDHPVVRTGLQQMVNASEGRFLLVGEGDCAQDAIGLHEALKPDIVILDLHMPGGGLTALRAINSAGRKTACIVLSAYDDPELKADAVAEGAACFVTKAEGIAPLRAALDQVTSVGQVAQHTKVGAKGHRPIVRNGARAPNTTPEKVPGLKHT